MDISYNWEFPIIGVYPQQYDRTDMVYTVVWKLFASTIANSITYTTGATGTIDVIYNPLAEWVDLSNLTSAELQHWVEDQMEIDNPGSLIALKANLDQTLQNDVNNTMVMMEPPWLTTTTTTTIFEETTTTTTTIV